MKIDWSAPIVPNGVILGYQLTWLEDGQRIDSTSTKENVKKIDDLEPCTQYEFRVKAETSKGFGPAAEITRETPASSEFSLNSIF